MAMIKPFRGLRYSEKAGKLDELCCPPYDIISEKERLELLKKNPHNIIRLEMPKSPTAKAEDSGDDYKQAGRVLAEWLDDGIVRDDETPGIYVYEFSFIDEGVVRAVKGFVALVKIEEFSKGIVLPHEETLSKAKTDRFSLMTETGCNFSQIYSLYQDKPGVILSILDDATGQPPVSEFTDDDNVTHRLWVVENQEVIAKVASLMDGRKVFIADGHHRYETAMAFYKQVGQKADCHGTSAFVPMMLVNMENPGLTVWPTHRIVRDLTDFDYAGLVAKSSQYFDITENLTREKSLALSAQACDDGKNAFVLYDGGGYTLMVLKDKSVMDSILPDSDESLRYLDVSVLHSLVLQRLFGIDKENMAAQKNLTYTRSLNEAVEAVGNSANCSFLLNATPISEISNVASTGGKMPQKSTYFYPKLTTGLVMNRIFKQCGGN
jgi:uncharacterized protein (DUF1015 family)